MIEDCMHLFEENAEKKEYFTKHYETRYIMFYIGGIL